MVFNVFQKLFTTLKFNIYFFEIAYCENAYLNPPHNSFSVINRFFQVNSSLAAGKMHKNKLSQVAFGMILQNPSESKSL